ncbi:hypothetical protein [Spirosoma pomorum]
MNQLFNGLKTCLVLIIVVAFMRGYYSLYINLDKQPKPFMAREEWLVEGAGSRVVPLPAQLAARLIDSLHIKNYHPVGQLVKDADGYVIGCLNQTAWPARMDSTSRNLVGYYQDIAQVPGVTIKHNYEGICIGGY